MQPYSFLQESLEGIGVKDISLTSKSKVSPTETLKLSIGDPEEKPDVKISEYEIQLTPKSIEIKD